MNTQMKTDRPVLFLDVDGVLNCCGRTTTGCRGLMPTKIALLQKVIEAADPLVVVSSTWRKSDDLLDRVKAVLRSVSARYGGVTPVSDRILESGLYGADTRGKEIQQWLDANGNPSNFAIVDDDSDMGHLTPHLVKTTSYEGLTEDTTNQLIRELTKTKP